jgi:hypothetical protein
MRQPHVDDHVRLTADVPELSLRRGEVGVVRSMWFAPLSAFEVEFWPMGGVDSERVLLMPEQVELAEALLDQTPVLNA